MKLLQDDYTLHIGQQYNVTRELVFHFWTFLTILSTFWILFLSISHYYHSDQQRRLDTIQLEKQKSTDLLCGQTDTFRSRFERS